MSVALKQDSKALDRPRFHAFDGFRGILALLVAIYHTYWPSNINSTPFLNNGTVLIDLFFIFSGFLLFNLYENHISNGNDAILFLKKRLARLYPLHLFTLGIFVVYAFVRIIAYKWGIAHLDAGEVLPFESGAAENISSLISNLFLLHAMGFHDALTFNVPSWTISVEFVTYITFTSLLIWARPKKFVHFALLAVGVVALYYNLYLSKPNMDITYDLGFQRCLAGFYMGLIVAKVYMLLRASDIMDKIGYGLYSFVEIFIVILTVLFIIYCPGKLQFLAPIFLFLFVLVFAFDKGMISRFLKYGIFKYLAKISYSVYMMHMIFAVVFYAVVVKYFQGATFLAQGINGDLLIMAYMACVLISSHFSYKYIEVKGNKFIMSLKLPKAKRSVQIISKS